MVFGLANLIISVYVDSESETMALLEANYKFHPERMIGYEMWAVDSKGHKHRINIHEVDNMELNEFVE